YPDVFVACDQSPNLLFHNRQDGTFENLAARLGVAFDNLGRLQNGMGVDSADFDHDGDMDLVVTTFSGQPTAFCRNDGRIGFTFASAEVGLGGADSLLLGFGCNFLDFDSDGWEDLFIANGHVNDHVDRDIPGVTHAEPAALYRNTGTGRFVSVPPVPG